tara:strand:+ start:238474 stop:239346 length:873 start_codon:yes stop_codon:yes gene_type:complete
LNYSQLLIENSYPISVTLVFLGVYFIISFKIKKSEDRTLKSIRKRDLSDAIETDSPVNDQKESLRERGITGIENRFTFIKKALPLVLISLWCITFFMPYLGKIPSVYISVIAAILSVIVGVSLRPFLENLFSGVVISFFKAVRIGDTVIMDGHYGIIEEIGLTYSVLKRWDWNRIVVPNSKLLQKEVENLTMNDHFIWAHIEFFVSPKASIAKVEELGMKVAKESKYFNKSEEPSFWVMEMQKDTIKCWLAAWADNPSEAWELRNDLRTGMIKSLQKEGVDFHHYNIDRV